MSCLGVIVLAWAYVISLALVVLGLWDHDWTLIVAGTVTFVALAAVGVDVVRDEPARDE